MFITATISLRNDLQAFLERLREVRAVTRKLRVSEVLKSRHCWLNSPTF